MKLDAKIPEGLLAEKWTNHKFKINLVNPSNKRKYKVLIVGTGLAGASAAAALAELGYNVEAFSYHESPRRAHSIAAQGGINAAKNYPGDGDSIFRLFYDTIKGGDYRSREANVYRLAEVSNNIIDQCVAQGIPFAREYGGLLSNRSFGGAQVSRTFYARGQTGQQLLLGAYSALVRQMNTGKVNFHARTELQDIVVVDGQAKGIITRNLVTGKLESHAGDAVVMATGGYGNVFFLSTNAMASNGSAAWRAHKKGALFANPCFTQIHPTCIPVASGSQSKLTLMSESLRNDGRIWVPKKKGDDRAPGNIPEDERDYYLERLYPSFGNLVPRDVASRRAKEMCDMGHGVGATKLAVYLDFEDVIGRNGKNWVADKYGNLFDMYEEITGENPYKTPMRIYPAVHYTMGGLWVDYNLMSSIPGLYVMGEANFSDHGANRLGASALMQGLADGYFVIPYTIADYLSGNTGGFSDTSASEFIETEKGIQDNIQRMLSIKGSQTVDEIHKKLGLVMWENVGMARNKEGLKKAIIEIPKLRKEFWEDVNIPGSSNSMNTELEKAGRLADFLELGELMARDALEREESCGGHFREEFQTEENEAKRDDKNFTFVSAWEFKGVEKEPVVHKEDLVFENVKLTTRSYK
ncbi:MAG: fumarate reductase/succinate dehydrogenase flavoprotein subunit [Candidatus Marinimicrobia bacterium]|mgnify:FL=1|jgi:succinate dehydrogenase / fumarate reductase flavoprotein subunit|nr:fumarate reductase/succinate dehydrogenase flavoprotein subunit [Candidatus Neomarinimicrobiota bacterium]MBT3632955.1 fumarate reductase/succinate dehydrogenase flavoprotein subunit [Candidatus Neomarinimicrobiota bacterium]MBT3682065.1 fumarate reductase/succinate dehydrogenase flavoprotein subunit [Candidatus Neomarinimicrobiota bacterium]MBT3758906.1 fumarate reductase/succinate dehydrogenase flavoprotein subunit [Candidatus Neomarinimicrobiota bacterium]MBT3895195.1 fumarate reductase/s